MHPLQRKINIRINSLDTFFPPEPTELQSSGRLGLWCQWISNAEKILMQDLYNSFEHAMPKTCVEALLTNMCKALV